MPHNKPMRIDEAKEGDIIIILNKDRGTDKYPKKGRVIKVSTNHVKVKLLRGNTKSSRYPLGTEVILDSKEE